MQNHMDVPCGVVIAMLQYEYLLRTAIKGLCQATHARKEAHHAPLSPMHSSYFISALQHGRELKGMNETKTMHNTKQTVLFHAFQLSSVEKSFSYRRYHSSTKLGSK